MDWKEEFRNALLDTTENPPDIREIVKPHIPKRLYKYGNFKKDYWKETIYKGKIHRSPAKVFNDPFDCKANFDFKKVVSKGKFRDELIKEYGKDVDAFSDLPDKAMQTIMEQLRGCIYVSCFSEVWNSILMWAHYANNYNGFCVEYDMSQVRYNLICNLFPVLYEKYYIDITDKLLNYNKNAGTICNLSKAEEWSYEKEWRIIEGHDNPIYFRKQLKAVYLGMNCFEMYKQDIIQWAKENSKEVYMIKPSPNKYELESQRIV